MRTDRPPLIFECKSPYLLFFTLSLGAGWATNDLLWNLSITSVVGATEIKIQLEGRPETYANRPPYFLNG